MRGIQECPIAFISLALLPDAHKIAFFDRSFHKISRAHPRNFAYDETGRALIAREHPAVLYWSEVPRIRLPAGVDQQIVKGGLSPSDLMRVAALAVVYFLAGKLGLKLAFLNASASAVWPPTGIALAAVLLLGSRVWPGIWLGAFLVNITTAGTVLTSVGIATGNTLEPMIGAWLVERFAHGRRAFDSAGDIFRFILLAAILSTMASATLGVTSLTLGGFVHPNNYLSVWSTWWLGDMVSAMIVAPLILIWSSRPFPQWSRRQIAEGLMMLALVICISFAIFGARLGTTFNLYARPFLCFPLVLWGAFRFGQRGAVTAALAVSGVALGYTVRGSGPLMAINPNDSLVLLQTFTGAITMSALVFAAAVSEHREDELALRASQARLAGLVDSAMDAIIAVDAERRIVLFNPAAEQMFGCAASEALGQSLDRFVPARFREAHRQHIEQFGQTGATNRRMGALGALSGVRANGEEFPIEASISHMKAAGQQLFTVILRDITARQQAEVELEAWRRELETRVAERTAEVTLAHQQLQAESDQRKRLETEISRVVEREQLRIGQELHDGLGQQLTGISYLLTALRTNLKNASPARVREVRRLQTMIAQSIEQTRSLARGFYPVELERLGLRPALEEYARHLENSFGVSCIVQSDGSACDELKGSLAVQLFRIAQEAMHNAAKHAHAKQIVVRLATMKGHLALVVNDDGFGFQPDTGETQGMGIQIMRHRARMIGGSLEILNAPQGGVSVACLVPNPS
jgi:PAS domain S-box-containing protein